MKKFGLHERFLRVTSWSLVYSIGLFGILASGGGGGGSTVTGESISSAYFPNEVGDTWAYLQTSSDVSGPFFNSVSVTGTKLVLGASTSVFLSTNDENLGIPYEEYYVKDARAFTNYGNDDPDDWLTPAIVPYDEVIFNVPLVDLPLFSRVGRVINEDLDADTVNERVDVSATINFDRYETLTEAAGTFVSAAKATATIKTTVYLSSGGSIPAVSTISQWRVPGFGLIKEVSTTTIGGSVDTGTSAIHGFRVNGVGVGYLAPSTLAAGVATANSDNQQPGQHAVGTDGMNFLLVSRQQTNIPNIPPMSKWIGRRILGDGTIELPFDLSSTDANSSGDAAIAFDGTNYLILTYAGNGIGAQRLNTAGGVIDATPIPISPDGFQPALAYGAGVYLAVYTRPAAGIYGVLVTPSGIVGSEFSIYSDSGVESQSNPSIAFDGTNFLVVWSSVNNAGPDTSDIRGARIAADGTIINNTITLSTAVEGQNYPQVACDATNCLVIWVDRRNYPGQPYNFEPGPGDIYGTRIDSLDALLDGLPDTGGIAIATGITANAGYPGLAYNGAEYIAAWSRGAFINNPGGPTGIFAGRVSTEGTVTLGLANTGVSISGPPDSATRLYFVAMAGSAGGTIAAWLNNKETFGTTKSISGSLMYPLVGN